MIFLVSAFLCSNPVGLQVLNFEVVVSVLNVIFCCFSWDLLPLSITTSQLPLLPLSEPSLPLNFSVSALFNLVSVSEVFLQYDVFYLLEEDVCWIFQGLWGLRPLLIDLFSVTFACSFLYFDLTALILQTVCWFISSYSREGNGNPLQYPCLENPMDRGAWWAAVHGVAKSQAQLSVFTLTFHFHALEKEMATHSSVLAWRIPGTEEPGGLPSVGLHRVGHDWSDFAAVVHILFISVAYRILRCPLLHPVVPPT